jgi:hypothetical protein
MQGVRTTGSALVQPASPMRFSASFRCIFPSTGAVSAADHEAARMGLLLGMGGIGVALSN